jgi:glucose/arabinose dehydrogenase
MRSKALGVLVLLLMAVPLQAAVSIQLEPVLTTGLRDPTYVCSAHDGTNRLFILELAGRIQVLERGATTPRLFLDISSRVLAGGERGLLGLAFHPQFGTNRRFFVDYTRRGDGATIIAEYRASADGTVGLQAETLLLQIAQPFENHNGGMLEFGPDGFLYIAMGDGGSGGDPGNRAQNPDDLLGKILRIDVDRPESGAKPYSSPATNPFAAGGGRAEVYALGLRNPWRFSFDRLTGKLWAGDVGQDNVEEVDVITLGGNYGWRVLEGTQCYRPGAVPCSDKRFIAPVTEYLHTRPVTRCSVIGGYVYRGAQFALPLGSYVYADHCTGEIFLLEGSTSTFLLKHSLPISSFGEDEQGEIYVVGYTNGGGALHRIKTPSAPQLQSLYFPRLGSGSGGDAEFAGLAVVNLDSTDATVRFTAYDGAGNAISGSGLTNPSSRLLLPGEQLPVVDSQVFGAGLSGRGDPGWVKLESPSGKVTGFFLVFDSSLTVMDGGEASTKTVTSFVFPEVEPQGFTRFHAANPGTEASVLRFELVNSSGDPRTGPVTRTVSAGGALAESLESLFPGVAVAASDYVRVSATRGVIPFEYLGRKGLFAEGINGQDASAGARLLYAPQYAVGGPDWTSRLSIVNLDSAAGTVTLELVQNDGTRVGAAQTRAIAAAGKLWVDDPRFFVSSDSLTDGYVRITSSGPRLAGSVVFGDPARSRFAAALPLASASATDVVLGQVASNGTYFMGIALLNPGGAAARATLELFDAAGARLDSADTQLPAGNRSSRLLTQIFPGQETASLASGYVKVRSDQPLAVFALFGTRVLSALSAIPSQTVP